MGLFGTTNQKLSILQRTWLFKIVFMVVGVLLVSSYLLPASLKAYEFDGLAQKIYDVLREADLSKGEGAAVEFVEEGSVTVDGVTYTDERLTPIAASFFVRFDLPASRDGRGATQGAGCPRASAARAVPDPERRARGAGGGRGGEEAAGGGTRGA